MDKREFSIFASALRTYYPREKLLPNEQAMELWFNQLQDIPYKVATTTLNKWVAIEKWSPSIADIRHLATEIVNGAPKDWGDGWEQVEKAIRYYGGYRELEALESLDEVTRQVVKRLGFKNLCQSENLTADRANFRMIYEQMSERKEKDAQIPIGVKEVIAQITASQLLIEKGGE